MKTSDIQLVIGVLVEGDGAAAAPEGVLWHSRVSYDGDSVRMAMVACDGLAGGRELVAVRRPFGFGAHGCIGAALGRLVATTAIQGWPWGEFEPVPGPRGRRRLAIGYKSMSSRPCRGRY